MFLPFSCSLKESEFIWNICTSLLLSNRCPLKTLWERIKWKKIFITHVKHFVPSHSCSQSRQLLKYSIIPIIRWKLLLVVLFVHESFMYYQGLSNSTIWKTLVLLSYKIPTIILCSRPSNTCWEIVQMNENRNYIGISFEFC